MLLFRGDRTDAGEGDIIDCLSSLPLNIVKL